MTTLDEFTSDGRLARSLDERCHGFNGDGERWEMVAGSDGYCGSCSASTAVFTTAEVPGTFSPERHGTVRDILRDSYGFDPLDAVILSPCGGSALSVIQKIEGKLATIVAEDATTAVLNGHEYTASELRALLKQVRDRVTSETVRTKWAHNCRLVTDYGSRCGHPVDTGGICGFHGRRGDGEKLIRVDEHLDAYGPGGGAE